MLRGTVHRSVLSGVVGAWLIGLGCQGPPHPLAYRMQGGEDSGGAGGSEEESVPLPVCHDGTTTGCASIVSLAAGGRHSCAAASDGVVRCWGANDSYQLGDPTGPPSRRGKRVLSGLRDPDEMVLGWRHGCAMSGSSAHCWGRNHMGQLGTSDKVFTARPARVRDEVARIATFGRTTCSLAIDDDVHCWGLSLTGQGWIDEDHGVSSSVPALVDGLDDVDTIAVGHYHACAASRDGTVWCWGEGTNGALGQGEAVSSALPVEVVGLPPPLRLISAGDRSTCAYAGAPAALYCWGWLAGDASTPSLVEGLPSGTVRQLELGWRHACVLLDDGRVACWGDDGFGQLGRDEGEGAAVVEALADVAALAVGWDHACALGQDGEVRCWGANAHGQLGRETEGSSDASPLPVRWEGFTP